MTKIKLYPNDTNITGDDKWIGTDGNDNDITKNFTVDAVGTYINALGVETVSTSDGTFIDLTPNAPTIGDVIVTADLSATGTPSGTTFLRGDNTWATPVDTDTTYDLSSNQDGSNVEIVLNVVGPARDPDIVTLVAGTNVTLTDDGSNNITINSTTYDLASAQNGSNVDIDLTASPLGDVDTISLIAGTNIQLVDDGVNNITINSTTTGLVDGTGTANFIPKWQDTDTLTDSFVEVGSSSLDVGTDISVGFTDVPGDYQINFDISSATKLAIRDTAVSVSNANFASSGYVKVGQTTATAAGSIAGALRYRSDANNSYLEVCMQNGDGSYIWHVIQTYTW